MSAAPSLCNLSAGEIVALLDMVAHPEGGWYRETWRAAAAPGERAMGTAILFLLKAGESSHWHRIDGVEIWHFHAGAPLELRIAADAAGPAQRHRLGIDLAAGEFPQLLVPAGHWQSARSLGAWTLLGCTVTPGFRFDRFELAPPDFEIS